MNSTVNPVVSIVAPAIKVGRWENTYQELSKNDIPFEIVYAGHVTPIIELPPNFRHIFCDARPALCAELVTRLASGKFIWHVADDLDFPEHVLDKFVEKYEKLGIREAVLSGRISTDNNIEPMTSHHLYVSDMSSPLCPFGPFILKEVRDEFPIDHRFNGIFWDIDLVLRINQKYNTSSVIIFDDIIINETTGYNGHERLCNRFWGPDRGLLDYLWPTTYNAIDADGIKIPYVRTDDVHPFEEAEIQSWLERVK